MHSRSVRSSLGVLLIIYKQSSKVPLKPMKYQHFDVQYVKDFRIYPLLFAEMIAGTTKVPPRYHLGTTKVEQSKNH